MGNKTADQVIIDVVYAGVNRADLMQRAGHYPPPAGVTDVLGLEVSGVVREVIGSPVSTFNKGDKVCALLAGGGYASRVAVNAEQVVRIPEGMSLEQASALPESFATAWLNLIDIAQLQMDEKVVIHGAASGVGLAAIQLAKWRGAKVFASVGSDEKASLVQDFGAEVAWNRHQNEFVEAVKSFATDGVDVILDTVGGTLLAAHQQALGLDGRMVVIGLLGGRDAELDMGRLLMKRQRIMGSTLRSLPSAQKGRLMHALVENIWPALSTGDMRMPIARVFDGNDVDAAHEYVRNNQNIGKVLLRFGESD